MFQSALNPFTWPGRAWDTFWGMIDGISTRAKSLWETIPQDVQTGIRWTVYAIVLLSAIGAGFIIVGIMQDPTYGYVGKEEALANTIALVILLSYHIFGSLRAIAISMVATKDWSYHLGFEWMIAICIVGAPMLAIGLLIQQNMLLALVIFNMLTGIMLIALVIYSLVRGVMWYREEIGTVHFGWEFPLKLHKLSKKDLEMLESARKGLERTQH